MKKTQLFQYVLYASVLFAVAFIPAVYFFLNKKEVPKKAALAQTQTQTTTTAMPAKEIYPDMMQCIEERGTIIIPARDRDRNRSQQVLSIAGENIVHPEKKRLRLEYWSVLGDGLPKGESRIETVLFINSDGSDPTEDSSRLSPGMLGFSPQEIRALFDFNVKEAELQCK